MPEYRSRRGVLAALGATGATALAGCLAGGSADGTDADSVDGTATVFHAGSLEHPMDEAEDPFESKYGVDVDREAKGSVGSTKKITEQGRTADVLGVSDFRLLRDLLLPEFGDWYAVFATNAMTVAYTDDSAYADEFGPDTWWKVLARDDVSVAHSDPAVDPNGYRSVMAMRLGAVELDGTRLYGETNAKAMEENAEVGSGTETELVGQLQSGSLDYAWEYQSSGSTQDVQTVDLQPHVDLSKATRKYAMHYATVSVEAGGSTYRGAPIAYGITVPSVAENPEAGAAWVEYFASDPGRTILRESGFTPVEPVVVPESTVDAVPDRVMEHAEAKSSLGPLDLDSA